MVNKDFANTLISGAASIPPPGIVTSIPFSGAAIPPPVVVTSIPYSGLALSTPGIVTSHPYNAVTIPPPGVVTNVPAPVSKQVAAPKEEVEQPQTLQQQEEMHISGSNARHMVMQKLLRKSDVCAKYYCS